jgi:hypothetical protein
VTDRPELAVDVTPDRARPLHPAARPGLEPPTPARAAIREAGGLNIDTRQECLSKRRISRRENDRGGLATSRARRTEVFWRLWEATRDPRALLAWGRSLDRRKAP